MIEKVFQILVGDANGADRALQQHMADRGYKRVVVYAVTGMLRNNVGCWEVRSVDPPRGARGFDLYSVKDTQMAKDASYGLMLWDGKSRGTLENMRNLLAYGKPVTVHLAPTRCFVSLRSTEDLHKLGIASLPDHGGQCVFPFDSVEGAAQEAAAAAGRRPSHSGRSHPKRRRAASARGRS